MSPDEFLLALAAGVVGVAVLVAVAAVAWRLGQWVWTAFMMWIYDEERRR